MGNMETKYESILLRINETSVTVLTKINYLMGILISCTVIFAGTVYMLVSHGGTK